MLGGVTFSNSWASAIKSAAVPFFTLSRIGSISSIASATLSIARGNSALYWALDRDRPRRSTVRIIRQL